MSDLEKAGQDIAEGAAVTTVTTIAGTAVDAGIEVVTGRNSNIGKIVGGTLGVLYAVGKLGKTIDKSNNG